MLMSVTDYIAARHAYLDYRLQVALNQSPAFFNFENYWKGLENSKKDSYRELSKKLIKAKDLKELIYDTF